MKTVICLIPFSDGVLSMYKGQIASIDSTKAEALIANGYVEAVSEVDIVEIKFAEIENSVTCDHSISDISAALDQGKPIIATFEGMLATAAIKAKTTGSHYNITFTFTKHGYAGGDRLYVQKIVMSDQSESITKTLYYVALTASN